MVRREAGTAAVSPDGGAAYGDAADRILRRGGCAAAPGGRTLPTMRASLEAHLGSWQVGKVVYGSIIGLALVVALSGHPPTSAVMGVWLVGTAIAVGLAEVYAEYV